MLLEGTLKSSSLSTLCCVDCKGTIKSTWRGGTRPRLDSSPSTGVGCNGASPCLPESAMVRCFASFSVVAWLQRQVRVHQRLRSCLRPWVSSVGQGEASNLPDAVNRFSESVVRRCSRKRVSLVCANQQNGESQEKKGGKITMKTDGHSITGRNSEHLSASIARRVLSNLCIYHLSFVRVFSPSCLFPDLLV